ncbi:hypothetical protein ACLPJK_26165 [Pseudomonas aeruginosa]|uniref:hypothetical protein n=1 Tax=Pseudomonas aeruginosa TaxID=287 RepID=UPI003D2BD50B
MRVEVRESETVAFLLQLLFSELEPDFPYDIDVIAQFLNESSTAPDADQGTWLSISVQRAFLDALHDAIGAREQNTAARLLMADRKLMALLNTPWDEIHVLDNKGTFCLIYYQE